jgi:hypothetical protein
MWPTLARAVREPRLVRGGPTGCHPHENVILTKPNYDRLAIDDIAPFNAACEPFGLMPS